jgi:hypothetical protein
MRLALTPTMAETVLFASEDAGGRTRKYHVNLTRDELRARHVRPGAASAATAFHSMRDAAAALTDAVNSATGIPFIDRFSDMPDGKGSGDLELNTSNGFKARYGGGEMQFVAQRVFVVMEKRRGFPHSLFVLKIYPVFTR